MRCSGVRRARLLWQLSRVVAIGAGFAPDLRARVRGSSFGRGCRETPWIALGIVWAETAPQTEVVWSDLCGLGRNDMRLSRNRRAEVWYAPDLYSGVVGLLASFRDVLGKIGIRGCGAGPYDARGALAIEVVGLCQDKVGGELGASPFHSDLSPPSRSARLASEFLQACARPLCQRKFWQFKLQVFLARVVRSMPNSFFSPVGVYGCKRGFCSSTGHTSHKFVRRYFVVNQIFMHEHMRGNFFVQSCKKQISPMKMCVARFRAASFGNGGRRSEIEYISCRGHFG